MCVLLEQWCFSIITSNAKSVNPKNAFIRFFFMQIEASAKKNETETEYGKGKNNM